MARRVALAFVLGAAGGVTLAAAVWHAFALSGGVGVQCRGYPEDEPVLHVMASVGPTLRPAVLFGLAAGPPAALLLAGVVRRGLRHLFLLGASLSCLWLASLCPAGSGGLPHPGSPAEVEQEAASLLQALS
jgi:hypothetical protein